MIIILVFAMHYSTRCSSFCYCVPYHSMKIGYLQCRSTARRKLRNCRRTAETCSSGSGGVDLHLTNVWWCSSAFHALNQVASSADLCSHYIVMLFSNFCIRSSCSACWSIPDSCLVIFSKLFCSWSKRPLCFSSGSACFSINERESSIYSITFTITQIICHD